MNKIFLLDFCHFRLKTSCREEVIQTHILAHAHTHEEERIRENKKLIKNLFNKNVKSRCHCRRRRHNRAKKQLFSYLALGNVKQIKLSALRFLPTLPFGSYLTGSTVFHVMASLNVS